MVESKDKTAAPYQMRQTDFRYLKVIDWGCFYLSTILDGFSRYIIAWKLCTTMKTSDVTDTLELALQASGCDQINMVHRPLLLSDIGASYISGDLAEWLDDNDMDHVRGAPYHPQIQGKIAPQRCSQRLPANGDGGIKLSRTASCLKSTSHRAISMFKSESSLPTTIISITTKA